MNDGSTIQGRITAQTRSEISVLTNRGAMRIDKSRISRISFQDDSSLDVKDQDRFDPSQVDDILKKRAEREKTTDRLGVEKAGSGALFIDDMKVSRWEYVWRSALLPGWGHIYGRQWKEGIGYSTVFTLTAVAAVGLYTGAISSQHTYKNSINFYYAGRGSFLATPQDHDMFLGLGLAQIGGHESSYHKNVNMANAALAGLGGVYLWQLAHAYWFGVSEERKDEGLSFHVAPSITPAAITMQNQNILNASGHPSREISFDRGLDIGMTFAIASDSGSVP